MKGKMTTSELIKTVSNITLENIDTINKLVGNLNEDQLKWRPDQGFWNISEVLSHLNEYSRYYQPTFKKKISSTRFTSTKEAFLSSPLGRSAWKSMKLGNAKNIKRKFKAQKGYNPSIDSSLLTGREFEDFIKHQIDLQSIIELAQTVNMKRVKIPISISKIVRLRLGDALLFVVYHNERHVQQIANLVNHPNFPKA
ncbi:DinB family protein [Crocinitomicaceae bacterium]|nr:DinB family protein [Crocinitomicaceae bacterium]MDB4075509.1 DinB family protein [Crocinitomicaceae bacterium]MDC0098890.1 DinB family protein [Crocinitomicaceae bacterium]|tara:strand:+ start:2992 stop:3582 length:591 start_codon:yes stop_codon:yes gene_type:complete